MKFYGKIGFWDETVEIKPGVFKPQIVEREYYGDVLRNNQKFQQRPDYQNDDFTISNQISILADMYAQEHLASIRYVVWSNAKWKVSTVEVSYPRIVLNLGGTYNENTNRAT